MKRTGEPGRPVTGFGSLLDLYALGQEAVRLPVQVAGAAEEEPAERAGRQAGRARQQQRADTSRTTIPGRRGVLTCQGR